MNNGRDCVHGRQVGKCDTCNLIDAEQRILELEAQVEQLREDLARCRHQASYSIGGVEALQEQLSKIRIISNTALAATPTQCLVEIKAQAVEDAGKYLLNLVTAPPSLHFASADALYKLANKLRQQAKRGDL